MPGQPPVREYRDATWRAINGHILEGQETRVQLEDGSWTEWRTVGWNAQHSDDCPCETGGADMEDW